MSPKNTAIDRSDWPDSRELRIPVNLACAASLVRHWQGAGVHSGKSVDLSRRTGGRIPRELRAAGGEVDGHCKRAARTYRCGSGRRRR
jgi:hypothetical protein